MLVEELCGGLMRIRAHNRECTDVIARILDPTLRDLFGFPQGTASADNNCLMFLHPCLPGHHAFSFLGTTIGFGKSIPGHTSRAGFAAKEHCQISIVHAHDFSVDLRMAGWNNNSI